MDRLCRRSEGLRVSVCLKLIHQLKLHRGLSRKPQPARTLRARQSQPACCSWRVSVRPCLASGGRHKHDEALGRQRCHMERVHGHHARRKAAPLSLPSHALRDVLHRAARQKVSGAGPAACAAAACSAAHLSIACLGAVQDYQRVRGSHATS